MPPAAEPTGRSNALIDSVITRARELNGGDLDDDLAVLVVSCSAPAGP